MCYTIWSDNNIVCNLSDFHTPKVVDTSVNRKTNINGVQERAQIDVPCPQQNIDYLETLHLIDKGNGAEVKYELGGQNRTHGWIPKLSCRLFNMNVNNPYRIYFALMEMNNLGKDWST